MTWHVRNGQLTHYIDNGLFIDSLGQVFRIVQKRPRKYSLVGFIGQSKERSGSHNFGFMLDKELVLKSNFFSTFANG
jgi:hypothetical protein